MLLSVGAARAQAFPALQLDILGGYYDPVTQTIISSGPEFTLVALLTPKNNSTAAVIAAQLNDTYYVSAAINPPVAVPSTLGSFTFNTLNYDVTNDLTYGTPPIELSGAGQDGADLGGHSIFPTYFGEFAFQFTEAQRTDRYDTAQNPGGLSPTTNTDVSQISYYQTFNITTSLTGDGNVMHFDLYNTYIRNCARSGGCAWDEDIALFAPFSHDAQSSSSVPEPQTLMVLSTGLLLAGRLLARRRQVVQ